jgi:transaldolase
MDVREFSRLLKQQNRDSEVWLDASPTCYSSLKKSWSVDDPKCDGMFESSMSEDFIRLHHGFTGATTNPRLITRAVLENAENWQHFAEALPGEMPVAEKTNRLYNEIIVQGAAQLHRLWIATQGHQGWISAQVDCSEQSSVRDLVQRGTQLARLAPNVMIKIPGSAKGYQAIEQLVAKGYSINNTFCFTTSQCAAALQAIHNGRARALSEGVSTDGARYVISYMIGRLGAEQEFAHQARLQRASLSLEEQRWAELAVYHAMQALLRRHATPARLLLCSLKVDADADGTERCWHLERTGIEPTLYTLTPEIVEFIQRRQKLGRPVRPAHRWSGVPARVMNKLLKLDYFSQAYFLDALPTSRFEEHPAYVTARENAQVARNQLRGFVEMANPELFMRWAMPSSPPALRVVR